MKKRTVKALLVVFVLLLIALIVSFFVDFKVFSYVIYGLFGVNFIFLFVLFIKRSIKRWKGEEVSESKGEKVGKWVVYTIPIIIIIYLLYANFLASYEFVYIYDIGEEREFKNNLAVLSPPDRISEPRLLKSTSYRDITSGLVYFNVKIPKGAKRIKTEIRFKNNFPDNGIFLLGAKDENNYHYKYKKVYEPFFETLSSRFENIGEEIKVYKINQGIKDIPPFSKLLEKPIEGIIIGTDDIELLNEKFKKIPGYIPSELTINSSLRGKHNFYVYVKGNFRIEVSKQDLNWYEGSDDFEVIIYDLKNNFIANKKIPDDGIINNKREIGKIQSEIIEIKNIPEGVYRIEFSDFDGIIRQIRLNQNRFVADGHVFLIDNNKFIEGIEKVNNIYFKSYVNNKIEFRTWHEHSFQKININSDLLEINKKDEGFYYPITKSPDYYNIRSEKNNIIISGPFYFSFSKESYFNPFVYNFIKIENDIKWIENNTDILVLDYRENKKDGEWNVGIAEFDLEELYIEDNNLNMVLSMPHLYKKETENNIIPIDWIKITIYKD